MSVSLCVCFFLFVCLFASTSPDYISSDLRQFLCMLPRPWLVPPMAALRYVLYFRLFVDDVMSARKWAIWATCQYRAASDVVVRRLTPLLRRVGCVVS